MQKKLSALLLALIPPVFYLGVRMTVQAVASAAARARVAASDPGLDAEWAANQARLAVRAAQPWLLAGSALFTLLLIALFFRVRGTTLSKFTGLSLPRPSALFILLEVGLGLNLGLNALILLLPLPQSWFAEHSENVSDALGASGTAAMALCTLLAAPVIEEVVFRGLSQRFLRRGFPAGMALLWQAVLFAAFHGTRLQMLYVFPAAVALGLVYQWSGTLIAPVVLHTAFNFFSMVSVPVPGSLWGQWVCLLAGAAVTALGLRGVWARSAKQAAPRE